MKIQDYNPFLGILELLGILFPGAVVALFSLQYLGGFIDNMKVVGDDPNSFLFGFCFLILSYFFGQVVFQLGSLVDKFYDKIKHIIYKQNELAKVEEIRGITKDGPKPILNTFEWSLMTLQNKENQKPYNEVVKIKADSKFFRAIFIIAFIGVIYSYTISPYSYTQSFTALLVMVLSFIFYVKIRQKCAKEMYKHIIYFSEKGDL